MSTIISTSPFGPWGTFLVLFLGSVFVLYLARTSAHKAIKGIFHLLTASSRLAAAALESTRKSMAERNREVLLSQGAEQVTRELNKEFFEISRFVQRDLGGYPQLQRNIQEKVAKIEDDYSNSGVVATALPEWIDAVDAVAKLKSSDKTPSLNSNILEQIHSSAEQQHKDLLEQHRDATVKRHKILKDMTPYWRKLAESVDEVGGRLKEIVTRSNHIDELMARFNGINAGTEAAVKTLKVSALTQFIISFIVIVIAAGGAFFNFHLIALPMSEMVGSVQRVGGIKVADLAALVIICLEITAGIFLLEGLRITKLFPLIGSMDDRARKTIIIASMSVLLILACTESALAFMRDQIAVDLANLRASLSGADQQAHGTSGINFWIPLAANMILGFVLPLALTMVAIPLEYLLNTGRTIFGSIFEIILSFFVSILRILGLVFRHLGKLFISVYDLYIAAPIWIEAKIKEHQTKRENEKSHLDQYVYNEPYTEKGAEK